MFSSNTFLANIIIDQMTEPRLVGDTLNEVDQDAVDLADGLAAEELVADDHHATGISGDKEPNSVSLNSLVPALPGATSDLLGLGHSGNLPVLGHNFEEVFIQPLSSLFIPPLKIVVFSASYHLCMFNCGFWQRFVKIIFFFIKLLNKAWNTACLLPGAVLLRKPSPLDLEQLFCLFLF